MANYNSARRRQQAARTRADIVAAARRLFAKAGYAATSMADIAAEAGVAVQTLYASCGTKREILLALLEIVEETSGVPELAPRAFSATDPSEVVRLGVRITRQLNERNGDILAAIASAAAADPEAVAIYEEGFERHRAGMVGLASRLAELGALRPELGPERAAAVFSVLTWSDSYQVLHGRHGWTWDQCEDWITEALTRLLLPAA